MRHIEFCNERLDKVIEDDPGLAAQIQETLEHTAEAYNQLEELLYRLRLGKKE